METVTISVGVVSPGQDFGTFAANLANNTYTEISEISPHAGNVVVAVPVTVSKVKAFFMISDLPVTVLRDGTGPQTWTLPADTPFFWHTDLIGFTNPITNNFTQLTISNADPDNDANVHVGFLLDQD